MHVRSITSTIFALASLALSQSFEDGSFEVPGGDGPSKSVQLSAEAAFLFSKNGGVELGAGVPNSPFGGFGLKKRSDPLIQYCRFVNFLGGIVVDHVTPGRCTQIPYSAFSLGVESLETSVSINCNLYRTLDCTGDYLVTNGVLPKLPAAYADTTQSYLCDWKDPSYAHTTDEQANLEIVDEQEAGGRTQD